jgi:hypothetical protein
VETNYRVYAYTSSPLRIGLLGLFVHMLYRMANLAVGVITRESVRKVLDVISCSRTTVILFLWCLISKQALLNGVTAEQVLSIYLSSLLTFVHSTGR